MISTSSVGVNILRVFRQALATKLDETSTATAMAVPHVQTLDMVEMVSLVSKSAIMVVMPTASPVWTNIGVDTRRKGAEVPIVRKTNMTHVAAPSPQMGISAG